MIPVMSRLRAQTVRAPFVVFVTCSLVSAAKVNLLFACAGPRVFLPAPYLEAPPEDVRLFDARALPMLGTPAEQVSILSSSKTKGRPGALLPMPSVLWRIMMQWIVPAQDDTVPPSSTVTAFSREIEEQPPKRELRPARNKACCRGCMQLLIHWPPLTPLVLMLTQGHRRCMR